MEYLGLFFSISIGVGIVSYFEGRRVGRLQGMKQGLKKGTTIGFEVGRFVALQEAASDAEKEEMLKELNLRVH